MKEYQLFRCLLYIEKKKKKKKETDMTCDFCLISHFNTVCQLSYYSLFFCEELV